MLYCDPVDTFYASFGDQGTLGELPGIKPAFNVRQFGAISGKGEYTWYFNRVMDRCDFSAKSRADKGWWDYPYDNLVFSHDYDAISRTNSARGTYREMV